MNLPWLDERPVIVAVAGPNGAGKTTFCRAHLLSAGLCHVSADVLAHELELEPYAAARVAHMIRMALVERGESFVFETVLSDPVGEKIDFLAEAARRGYTVVLCFIGIDDPETSIERVSMRVSRGGHDVPDEKLASRFPRILANLDRAVAGLPHVLVFDNQELDRPFRQVAIFEDGKVVEAAERAPGWLRSLLR